MPDPQSPDELRRRVAELERELAVVRSDRDRLRDTLYAFADELAPPDPNWQPPRPEDCVSARDLLHRLKQKYEARGA
jgi:hypothetical protein